MPGNAIANQERNRIVNPDTGPTAPELDSIEA